MLFGKRRRDTAGMPSDNAGTDFDEEYVNLVPNDRGARADGAPMDCGAGIYAVDSGYVRPRLAAIHLITANGRVALVDSAHNAALPRVEAALAALGFAREAVEYLFLTHVHLDHAGGAGAMMQVFPNAHLVVHPRGARHMADPGQLNTATAAVYGAERAAELYGTLVPVPEERIIATADGQVFGLGGREIQVLHTPGHAKHHQCFFDRDGRGAFTGDLFGMSYRELDRDGHNFVFPTTTPSQFNPGDFKRSIERVMALSPAALYLTHFSRVLPSEAYLAQLRRMLDGHVAVALAERHRGADRQQHIRQGLASLLRRELAAFGAGELIEQAVALFVDDLELNAQGLDYWLAHGADGAPESA